MSFFVYRCIRSVSFDDKMREFETLIELIPGFVGEAHSFSISFLEFFFRETLSKINHSYSVQELKHPSHAYWSFSCRL